MNEKTKKLAVLIPSLGLSAVMLFIALYEPLRTQIRSTLIKPYRKVLSTVEGQINREGLKIRVVKIQSSKGLSLEVYDLDKDELIDTITLRDTRDGYFNFRGQATNLALDDIDGDKVLEILAPSFDDLLVAHLNIFRFQKESQKFILDTGPDQ